MRDPRLQTDGALYHLIEGAAIDQTIALRSPGLVSELQRMHHAELDGRPPLDRLGKIEREVESVLRERLSQPLRIDGATAFPASADESLALARVEAARIRRSAGSAKYRGIRSVAAWYLDSRAPMQRFEGQ